MSVSLTCLSVFRRTRGRQTIKRNKESSCQSKGIHHHRILSFLFSSYPFLWLSWQTRKQRKRAQEMRTGNKKERKRMPPQERQRVRVKEREPNLTKNKTMGMRDRKIAIVILTLPLVSFSSFSEIYTHKTTGTIYYKRDTWVSVRGKGMKTILWMPLSSSLFFAKRTRVISSTYKLSIYHSLVSSWFLDVVVSASSPYRVLAYACNGYSSSSLFSRIFSFCRWYFLPELSLQHISSLLFSPLSSSSLIENTGSKGLWSILLMFPSFHSWWWVFFSVVYFQTWLNLYSAQYTSVIFSPLFSSVKKIDSDVD